MRTEDGAMTDLSEFLLARIAEDEEEARQAALTVGWDGFGEQRIRSGQRWNASYHVVKRARDDGPTDRREVADCGALFGISTANHIARHDPARVLAECDAKRRIVELHKSWPVLVEQQPKFAAPAAGLNDMTFRMTQQIAWVTQEEYRKRFGEEPPTTPMLRALALPYADHPDYDPAWQL